MEIFNVRLVDTDGALIEATLVLNAAVFVASYSDRIKRCATITIATHAPYLMSTAILQNVALHDYGL